MKEKKKEEKGERRRREGGGGGGGGEVYTQHITHNTPLTYPCIINMAS